MTRFLTLLVLLGASQLASAGESLPPRVHVEFPTKFLALDPDALKTMPADEHYGQDVALTAEIIARGPWELAKTISEKHRVGLELFWFAHLYRYDAATGHYRNIAWCRARRWQPNILEQAQEGDLITFGGGE